MNDFQRITQHNLFCKLTDFGGELARVNERQIFLVGVYFGEIA